MKKWVTWLFDVTKGIQQCCYPYKMPWRGHWSCILFSSLSVTFISQCVEERVYAAKGLTTLNVYYKFYPVGNITQVWAIAIMKTVFADKANWKLGLQDMKGRVSLIWLIQFATFLFTHSYIIYIKWFDSYLFNSLFNRPTWYNKTVAWKPGSRRWTVLRTFTIDSHVISV